MKLKYKKMVLLITMCTMGIGLVTFSISRPKDKATTAVEETEGDNVTFSANIVPEGDAQKSLAAAEITTTVTPEPTEAVQIETATATAKDLAGELEKNSNEDVNKLIKKYFKAKLSNDKDKFKSLVNDTDSLDLNDIERQTKYIEKYENINCFTKKGPEDGSYIVYAYHEVKFTSIETVAPGLNVFYVKTNEEGKPYIYLGEIDEKTDDYMNEVLESEDVMDLIYTVNEKLQKAVEDDGALAEFYLKLEESAKDVTKNE